MSDYNSSDAAHVSAARKREAFEKTEAQNDVVSIMRTASGRRFFWWLLSEAGVFRLSFAGEQTHVTAFHEGERNVGQKVLTRLMAWCPDDYQRMLKENNGDDRRSSSQPRSRRRNEQQPGGAATDDPAE